MAKIKTKKALKISLIVYAAILLVGILATIIWGPKLDINFSGGTKFSYSYTGDVEIDDFEATVKTVLTKEEFKVTQSEAISGDTTTFTISFNDKNTITDKQLNSITKALKENYKANDFELYDSKTVGASIAGTFFLKSLAAVLLTAVFVVIYVGIRFRKIGGVTAAVTALVALVLDLLVSYVACVVFRLEIDTNYMAVVLTILGYSLNDTIVIYDRVRENKKLYPNLSLEENMDSSVTTTMKRNIVTTSTTILAIITIIVVSEIFGLTTLRTFAIPMAFGLISGCISSLFVAGPLWVMWRKKLDA